VRIRVYCRICGEHIEDDLAEGPNYTSSVPGLAVCDECYKEPTMDQIYYYLRDNERKPIITVCLLAYLDREKGPLVDARGVAVCSPLDQPVKKKGRGIAYSRAIKALKMLVSTLHPINYVGGNMSAFRHTLLVRANLHHGKSTYMPELSLFEAQLIDSCRRKDSNGQTHSTGTEPTPDPAGPVRRDTDL